MLPQPVFENSYRVMLRRFEAKPEGREPPHAMASRDCIKLLEGLWSKLVMEFKIQGAPRARLIKAMEAVEAEIVQMQRERTLAELTKRRRMQHNRHEGARRAGQPSPVEV